MVLPAIRPSGFQNQIAVIFGTRAGYQSAIRMRVAWKVVPGA